tara:strand:- start:2941 stop:3291 length:351 start_codon:yes stop_codon:yes gene_type:complete
MIFLKYEFTDQETWEAVRATLYTEEGLIPEINAVVEIGHICFAYDEEGECTDLSTRFAVDMLLNEPVDSLEAYIVWPNPVGVHTFSGDDSLYIQSYCSIPAHSESPYCLIPDEDIS